MARRRVAASRCFRPEATSSKVYCCAVVARLKPSTTYNSTSASSATPVTADLRLLIDDTRPSTDCRPTTCNCQPKTFDCRLPTFDCRLPTTDCRHSTDK